MFKGKPRIAVVGANGQVGAEVCLFLNLFPSVTVIPICRTRLASSFLRRCGLDCRHGVIGDADDAARILESADVVVDFSLPTGTLANIRKACCSNIRNITRFSKPNATIVYISSLMALGMPGDGRTLKYRWLPRSSYASWKRLGERETIRGGKKHGHHAFVLRLGQVHGELQAVSQSLLNQLKNSGPGRFHVPNAPSFSVFAFSIAEALAGIANGEETPGTYSLVSSPCWWWDELLHYYLAKTEMASQCEVLYDSPSNQYSLLKRGIAAVKRPLFQWGNKHHDLLRTYLLRMFPRMESMLRARRNISRAQSEIAEESITSLIRPFGDTFVNEAPGKRLLSVTDSRSSMAPFVDKVRTTIHGLIH